MGGSKGCAEALVSVTIMDPGLAESAWATERRPRLCCSVQECKFRAFSIPLLTLQLITQLKTSHVYGQ